MIERKKDTLELSRFEDLYPHTFEENQLDCDLGVQRRCVVALMDLRGFPYNMGRYQ